MPSTEITLKTGQLITSTSQFIQQKEAEIEEGERVIEELSKIKGLSPTKLARTRGRVKFLKKFLELLKEGFIPIPRMEYEPITEEHFGGRRGWVSSIVIDQLPIGAITKIAEFQDKFDMLGVVRPAGRGRRRDPILIGITRYALMEEHFILGWWRPDVMKPSELW